MTCPFPFASIAPFIFRTNFVETITSCNDFMKRGFAARVVESLNDESATVVVAKSNISLSN
jgi:hypothetical protein